MLARQVILLTSSESFHPIQLPSRQQSTAVNPLAATLTKNRGWRSVIVNQLPLFPNVQTCLQASFVFNRFHTLPSSVSCNSFACLPAVAGHSYENCQVCTNNSHSGTQAWKIAAVKVCSSSSSTSHQSRFTGHKSPIPLSQTEQASAPSLMHIITAASSPPLGPGDRSFPCLGGRHEG